MLPGGLHGAALLAAARQAFTVGLLVTLIISAAVAVGIAVLATVLLRGVPGTSEAAPPASRPSPPGRTRSLSPGSPSRPSRPSS